MRRPSALARRRPARRPFGAGALVLLLVAGVGAPAAAATQPGSVGPAAGAVRVCPPPTADDVSCLALVRTDGATGAALRTTAPAGYGPSQLRSAYGLTGVASGHPLVAVADAFGDRHVAADLAAYRARYGLAPMAACHADLTAKTCFDVVTQSGATSGYPKDNAAWDIEQSLDVDMVSAACPKCSIVLVQADTASFDNLAAAEEEAVALGADVISNSFSGWEHPTQSAAYTHPGVAIVASTGDDGYQPAASAPAGYPGVVAVGGTTLSSITPRVESAWSGAGSFCVHAFDQPSWQSGVVHGCGGLAAADISVDADPATGVAVSDQGWIVEGGTSVASPFIAGSIAAVGNWADFGTDGASYLYTHRSALRAVTSGSNGDCGTALCVAHGGWDGPAGLGTPAGPGAL